MSVDPPMPQEGWGNSDSEARGYGESSEPGAVKDRELLHLKRTEQRYRQALRSLQEAHATAIEQRAQLARKTRELGSENERLRTEVEECTDARVRRLERENIQLKAQIDDIYASETWRTGRILLTIPKAIKRFLGRR